MKRTLLASLIAGVLCAAIFSQDAHAIPALSRKYKTTCVTCHATFPKLTALGEAIRLNGYKIPEGDELYTKEEPVSMGAPEYKKVFPEAVWPSDIPGLPPISLRFIGDLEYDIGDEAGNRESDWKLEFPHELELLATGSFGENMSFFGEVEYEHHDNGAGGSDTIEIDYFAWLMWEDILVENGLNFKVGNIGMHETELPNARDHTRITKEHYLYRDEITRDLSGPGAEVNGFGKMWRYAAGVVKPQNEFGDADYYVQASLKCGGLGYDGSGGTFEEGGLTVTPSGYWRDDSFLFGGFYYNGDDDVDRYGLDARVTYKDVGLEGGWVKEDDDATDLDEDVFFAQVDGFIYPWLQPYVRFEDLSADAENSDKARFVVGTVLLPRANVKVNVEGRFYTDNEPREAANRDKDVDNRIFGRLDFAF